MFSQADAEQIEPDRRISPLRPRDIRHTFVFSLSEATGTDVVLSSWRTVRVDRRGPQ